MLNIVLFQPEIPANTGNIIRLCANTGYKLHIVEPAAFILDDKRLLRAGIDYHEFVDIKKHRNLNECLEYFKGHNIYACTTKGHAYPDQCRFQEGDVLIFGKETKGLPDEFTDTLWNALDADNKISLYVRYTDLATGEETNRLINKNK